MSYASRAALNMPGSTFLAAVRAAALDYAGTVLAEPITTTNHEVRQSYADLLFRDATGAQMVNLGWVVSADNATTDSSSDAAILARVGTVWNQCAALATAQSVATSSGGAMTP